MKFLTLILTLTIFFNQNLLAKTSFDEKPQCLKEKGNWRKFSNGCVDRCAPQFNDLTFCTTAITYGCDCGKNRCLYKNQCIKNSEYEKIYQKIKKETEAKLEKLRQERLEKFNNDPSYAYRLHNLYKIPKPQPQNQGNNNQSRPISQGTQPTAPQIPTVQPQVRKIPPGYMQQNNNIAVNSDGQKQDLAFPVIPLPAQ